jgi:AraC-like DNA-binding protein
MRDEMSTTTSPRPGAAPVAEIHTTEPGVAHDWLRAAYAGYQPEESNCTRNFAFRGARRHLGRSSISWLHYSMSADNNVEPGDVLLVVQPTRGGMKVSVGREEEVVAPGSIVLFPPRKAVSALWADTDTRCVCLDAADVERVAVETTGMETITLRFTGFRPMSPGHARHWNDVVQHLMRAVLGSPAATAHPLVAGQLTQALAAAVLDTFPSTALATRRRLPPDHATPAVVRRATDVIEAGADRALTLSEIASAAGIGPRGLQAAFLRHLDTTPADYARRVRMERAHRDLRAADPAGSDTAPAIAARWGFADAARFATEYRQIYRHSPTDTLRS